MCIRIKDVIIITYNRIYPLRYIQCHFKRTHIPFPCLFFQHFPAHLICRCEQFINSSIYTVKMSFGIWTCIRITDSFLTETDLFFCRQCDDFHLQILLPQDLECLTCHRSGDRLRRQIKDLFSQFFCSFPGTVIINYPGLSHPDQPGKLTLIAFII